jgi:hypothetical protein
MYIYNYRFFYYVSNIQAQGYYVHKITRAQSAINQQLLVDINPEKQVY